MQVIATPKGPGSKRKFPNKGRIRYEGRNVGGTYSAKYLGTLVANTACTTPEVRSRIRKATAALTKLARHVWNQGLTLELKVQLYLALVRSVLCYGLECWHLTAGNIRDLEQFQNRALRWLAKAPAHKTHETSRDLRTRLGVPTVHSWIRLQRLQWLQTCIRHPEHHAQALCALFGSLPWDPVTPTVKEVPFLAQLADDLQALFPTIPATAQGRLTNEALQALGKATKPTVQSVLTAVSTHERGSAPIFGPRNAPTHACAQCNASFDTKQRLALHQWSAHGTRNDWRGMISEPVCPFCRGTFASLETARRHLARNVCGLRPAAGTNPIPPTPAPAPIGTLGTLRHWLGAPAHE